jgi:hypothetical protein
MEAVQNLEHSREELLGVEGAERGEGDGGNREAVPGPATAEMRRSVASYNR